MPPTDRFVGSVRVHDETIGAQARDAGLCLVVESLEGDLHLATSANGIRTVHLQGHPEHDAVSLLKEYRRELDRYAAGELDAIPPTPDRYLSPEAARRVHDHVEAVARAREVGRAGSGPAGRDATGAAPAFPEAELAAMVDTTWTDTGRALFNNWLGLIYRLTDVTRGVPFMPGVDPENPLGLGAVSR